MSSSSSCQNPMCMEVLNKSNQQPAVYIGETATLEVKLINKTGADITLESGKKAAMITIYPPEYFTKEEIGKMSITLKNWKFSVGNGGYSLDLTYLGSTDGTWGQGNTIQFAVTCVLSKASATTGQVRTNLSNMTGNSKFESTLLAPLNLDKPAPTGSPKLLEHLRVTLESSVVYVSNPEDPTDSYISNSLFLNMKNISSAALYQGTKPWSVTPVVNVSFQYGSTVGALAPDKDKAHPETGSAWNIMGKVAISEGNAWSVKNPETSGQADSPQWKLNPSKTNKAIIGTGANSNITFEFSNIISLLQPGHTQMTIQFNNFPYNDDKVYDNPTVILDIVKVKPKPGILKFTPVGSTILGWEPGTDNPDIKPNATMNWQVLAVEYVKLSWLGYCGSEIVLSSKDGTIKECSPDDKYKQIKLNEDTYNVDIGRSFPDNVIMNLDAFDSTDTNVGHEQVTFQFSKVITVSQFTVNVLAALQKQAEVEVIVGPKELISEEELLLKDSGALKKPAATRQDGAHFIASYQLTQLVPGKTISADSFFNNWAIEINKSNQNTYDFSKVGKVTNAFPKTTFTDANVELFTSIGLHNSKGSKLQLSFDGNGKTLTLHYIDLFTSNEYRTVSKLAYALSADGFGLTFKDADFVMASNGKGYYKGLSFDLKLSVAVKANGKSLTYILSGKATASNAQGSDSIDLSFVNQATVDSGDDLIMVKKGEEW